MCVGVQRPKPFQQITPGTGLWHTDSTHELSAMNRWPMRSGSKVTWGASGQIWFDGLTITLEENGDTLLTGPVADQAALHGLLKKVRDLGLPLVAVNEVQLDQKEES